MFMFRMDMFSDSRQMDGQTDAHKLTVYTALALLHMVMIKL